TAMTRRRQLPRHQSRSRTNKDVAISRGQSEDSRQQAAAFEYHEDDAEEPPGLCEGQDARIQRKRKLTEAARQAEPQRKNDKRREGRKCDGESYSLRLVEKQMHGRSGQSKREPCDHNCEREFCVT